MSIGIYKNLHKKHNFSKKEGNKTGAFFFFSVLLSLIFGIGGGKISAVSTAALSGAYGAVKLSLELLGSLCFWSGLMEAARRCKLTEALCRLVSPPLSLLFPRLRKEKKAMELISMNVTANLLGLGNAATPFGVAAMRELSRISGKSSAASVETVVFVVMDTASLQLIPTTGATLRAEAGAEKPLDILPAVWLVSALALLIGIVAAKGTFPGKSDE